VASDPRKLKPSELCRLLNSTPMGEVLSDRQLHRHRMRAGNRIGDGKHVDLLRYIAYANVFVLRVYMGERERVCIYNYFSASYRERRKKFWPTNLLVILKLRSLFSPHFSRLASPSPFPV
jgi:hypothetical protein